MKLKYDNQILEFKPIFLENREKFLKAPEEVIHVSCEYSFANLFMWGESYDMQWCMFKKAPLILIARDDVLLFPLVENISGEELIELAIAFKKAGGSGYITQIPEIIINNNTSLAKDFQIRANRDFADYIHLTESLASLSGRKLRKKRNLISQFIRNYPDFEDVSLTPELFDGCLKLTQENMIGGNSEHQDEIKAIKTGFANFAELCLGGRVILFRGQTIAFSVFSQHLDGSYLIHYEKCDHAFKGSGQMINLKTAEYLLDKCKYINREQDLGILGLKKAKLSYDPEKILINYDLIPN